jgi:hypothetical protein
MYLNLDRIVVVRCDCLTFWKERSALACPSDAKGREQAQKSVEERMRMRTNGTGERPPR